MDLYTLNAKMQPEDIFESYDSLIWTERFNSLGDFQLKSGKIDECMERLPEGLVVTLADTNVPMIVEDHAIVRKKREPAYIQITGRTFESILDRRVSIQSLDAKTGEWKVVAKIPSDVAHYIIYKICVEGIVSPLDKFPPEVVQFITPDDYLQSTGPNREYVVSRGNLLATVLGFLQTESKGDALTTPPTPELLPHGIRSMRPSVGGTAIGIEIYVGRDLSETVVFDGSREVLNDGSYLFSKKGSATDAYMFGQEISGSMSVDGTERSGLDRRVLLIDGSASTLNNIESLRGEATRAFSDARPTAIFDGSLNEDLMPYRYNVDYGLGDVVTLKGDYGLDSKARVTEYIRSASAREGYKAFPTLKALDE